jgi:hypothetical protein
MLAVVKPAPIPRISATRTEASRLAVLTGARNGSNYDAVGLRVVKTDSKHPCRGRASSLVASSIKLGVRMARRSREQSERGE